ncbi:MAG: hypothetical protein R3F29_07940 [Planctomycetota bacterium]
MTSTPGSTASSWLRAFLPLGTRQGERWAPAGGAVLLHDHPLVWLVTATEVLRSVGGADLTAWVPRAQGAGLLNLGETHRHAGITWIHHPIGLSASLFPLDESFQIKAFPENQCTRLRDLQPIHPAVTVGGLYSPDVPTGAHPSPAVCDGIVSSIDERTGCVYSTAPLLPRNLGAPLLLASPYGGGAVTLAGILLGNVTLSHADPRELPVRLSRSVCTDAAFELIRSPDADQQRERAAGRRAPEPGEAQP